MLFITFYEKTTAELRSVTCHMESHSVICHLTKGGATIGAGRDMSPPLLRDVPRRGYNSVYVVHLRVLQPAAKVTQLTFGFSTWKF